MLHSTFKSLSLKTLPLIFSLLLPLNLTAKESGRLFCFSAVKGDSRITLLGSIHMADEKFYPLPAVIEDSFKKSSALVVEADIVNIDQNAMQQAIMTKGMFTDDQDLTKILSASEMKELESYAAGIGLTLSMLIKMKPWLAVLTLSALKAQKEGLKPELGIDMHFLKQAKGSKQILEMEGAMFQIDLLSDFTDEEQKQFLKYTLKSEKQNKNLLKDMIKAWKSGDTAALEKILLTSFKETPDVEKKFLYDRNTGMIERVLRFARAEKELFVVVGAAHLIGERGMLKLLEKEGYTVTQLDKKIK